MDIVLFGIQGSGKGTLGKAIAEKYNFRIFETGYELRKISHEDSELGHKIKNIITAGHLVPNEIVMAIVENFLQHTPQSEKILFDGIPRQTEQSEKFDTIMNKFQRIFKGILIDVPKKVAEQRLSMRRICKVCKAVYPAFYKENSCKKCSGTLVTRSDDNTESIHRRIATFFEETLPVIDSYEKQQKIIRMNGDVSIEEAQKKIFEIIEKKLL